MGAIADAIYGLATGLTDSGISIWNAGQQQKNLAYTKKMQREAWAREDNAVQRRVADLKLAGLSPVLAAGSAASASSPVSTSPSQMDSVGSNILNSILQSKNISQMNAGIAQTKEQTKLIAEQIKGQGIENDIKKYDLDIAKSTGMPYGASSYGKIAKDVYGVTTKAMDNPKIRHGLDVVTDLNPLSRAVKRVYKGITSPRPTKEPKPKKEGPTLRQRASAKLKELSRTYRPLYY